jgi:hypothetical protein
MKTNWTPNKLSEELEIQRDAARKECEKLRARLEQAEAEREEVQRLRQLTGLLKDARLVDDVINALVWALEEIPDECNCESYMESDTGAWIHDENKCRIFTVGHIEATLDDLRSALQKSGQNNTDQSFHALTARLAELQAAIEKYTEVTEFRQNSKGECYFCDTNDDVHFDGCEYQIALDVLAALSPARESEVTK